MTYSVIQITILICAGIVLLVWLIAAWKTYKPLKAYDLRIDDEVHVRRHIFEDERGKLRSLENYELFIADKNIPGFCKPGDILACETQKPSPGSWCIWWDILAGPYICKLTEEDCCNTSNLPIIIYIIHTDK